MINPFGDRKLVDTEMNPGRFCVDSDDLEGKSLEKTEEDEEDTIDSIYYTRKIKIWVFDGMKLGF